MLARVRAHMALLSMVLLSMVLLSVGIGPTLAQTSGAPKSGTQERAASTVDTTPPGTLEPAPLPPLAHPDAPSTPAKELFARKLTAAPGPARAIGGYAKGCMAGAVELPITGPTWQVMRLSRNRNWGNPALVDFIARLGEAAKKEGWNGLLIGDMAQPRGGPMFSGHASHQIGLDVDIWFNPMPDHVMTREERELDGATNMVALSGLDVDHSVWTPARTALIRAAAKDPQVARIFVNAAIKKAMCSEAGTDRDWLAKVRPWWGHAEHFHVRLNCPPDSPQCEPQSPVGPGDGCGHELDSWFKESVLHPKPPPGPPSPRTGPTLAALPRACRQVVTAP
jgi:penicillin-insensitive murein endopeptidase